MRYLTTGIPPDFAKKALVVWACMLVAICVGGYFLLSQDKWDKEWCRAHALAIYAQTHPHVLCQDARGIRARPETYPVENSVWVIDPSLAGDAKK